jgi:hypothetical protein
MSALAGVPARAAPGDAARVNPNVPLAGGWSARFFVSPTTRETGLPDDAIIRRNSALGVNAQLSRYIGGNTRILVDVTNLLDRESVQQGLVPPADGRGLRIQLRRTF